MSAPTSALHSFGEGKFPEAGLLRSSAGRRWTGLAAELRAHPACEVPAICPDQMEITLALSDAKHGAVERRGDGTFQRTPVRSGTLWFCPIGVHEDSIRITADLPEILHLYIPAAQFSRVEELSSRPVRPDHIRYLADVDDEFVRQIGYRILREIRQETASGGLLVEQLALALATHLVAGYSESGDGGVRPANTVRPLDDRRLKRVCAYIEDHLDEDIALADLARVACLSLHHFARAFREAAGIPPHRYISARRLDRARQMLAVSDLSLAEIAFACRFSSQASFTRAFQRQTGHTPGQYRRSRAG